MGEIVEDLILRVPPRGRAARLRTMHKVIETNAPGRALKEEEITGEWFCQMADQADGGVASVSKVRLDVTPKGVRVTNFALVYPDGTEKSVPRPTSPQLV